MQIHSINMVSLSDGPNSECWDDASREMRRRHQAPNGQTNIAFHVSNSAGIVWACLEAGMRSGLASVMLHVDTPNGVGVIEMSLSTLQTIAQAMAAGCDARNWPWRQP